LCRGAGTFTRLLGHRKNVLDVVGHFVGQNSFAGSRRRNLLNQFSKAARHAVNFGQCGTG